MKIQIAEPAAIDLQEIRDYIRLDNPPAAARVISRIFEALEHLPTFPTMGRVGSVAKTRELVVSGTPFIIVYQVRERVVIVIRILHASRKWSNKKKNN